MERPASIAVRREPGPLVRSLAALALRVGLGLVFLMLGIGKFRAMSTGKYPSAITSQFAQAPLPVVPMKLFTTLLPYAEVLLGIFLICGFLTVLAGALAAALVLILLFGKLWLSDTQSLPGMLIYLLVCTGVIWLSPVTSNYFSLDGLVFGWFWGASGQTRYVPEPAAPQMSPAPPRPARPAPPAEPPRGSENPGFFVS